MPQPPVIQLPVANTEHDTEADKTKVSPNMTALTPAEDTATAAMDATPRPSTRKQRRAAPKTAIIVPRIDIPPVEPAQIAKSSPAQGTAELPPAVVENNAMPPPVSGTRNPHLNANAELHTPSSVPTNEPGTTIINYSGYLPDDPASIDFASISAVAPTPKPSGIKAARPASGLVVIVNKANSRLLSKTDISNIYRDRITRWPSGERILALNLPLDSGERRRFSAAILDMSPLDAATEVANRAITNRVQNEYRTKNAQVVVSYIEHHENAIGYVEAAAITENNNVRVVYSIP